MHSLTECYCDIDMNEAHVWAYSIDNSTVNEKSIQCEKFPHSFIMTFHSQAVGMLYNWNWVFKIWEILPGAGPGMDVDIDRFFFNRGLA